MTEAAIFQLLERIGFPVCVALWFMLRSDKKVDANTDTLSLLVRTNTDLVQANRELRESCASWAQRVDDLERRLEGVDRTISRCGGIAPEPVPPENTRRHAVPKLEGQ